MNWQPLDIAGVSIGVGLAFLLVCAGIGFVLDVWRN